MSESKISIYDIQKIREKYPDRIPIIITRATAVLSDIPNLSKTKFLVHNTLTFGGFIYIVRKQLKLPPEKSLFMFINNNLPPSSITMAELYSQYKDKTNVLQIVYTSESTFG